MTRPISFLSDFGHSDEFVGVVHGVLARIAPESRVIDVTHGVAAGDVRGGALALMRAIQYLPPGVALAVVDPGVGTSRRAIAAETPWGHFVGPDNGLLSPAVAMVGGAGRVVTIDNPDVRIPSEGGATFEGRDRFAPAAGLLAAGEASLDDLGPEVDAGSLTPMLLPLAEIEADTVRGEAWWIDHFGNVEINVSPEQLAQIGVEPGDDVVLLVGAAQHRLRWAGSYGEVELGEPLVHVDSYGLMAVAVRAGRADERFNLAPRTAVGFSRA